MRNALLHAPRTVTASAPFPLSTFSIPSPLYPHSYRSLAALTYIEVCALAFSFYLMVFSHPLSFVL